MLNIGGTLLKTIHQKGGMYNRIVKNEVTHAAMCVRCVCARRRGDTAQGSAIFRATAASFALRRPYFLVWPRY